MVSQETENKIFEDEAKQLLFKEVKREILKHKL